MTLDMRETIRQVEVKDAAAVFVCDACGAEQAGDHPEWTRPIVPAGWLTIEEAPDTTSASWPAPESAGHACGYPCLMTLAERKVRGVPA